MSAKWEQVVDEYERRVAAGGKPRKQWDKPYRPGSLWIWDCGEFLSVATDSALFRNGPFWVEKPDRDEIKFATLDAAKLFAEDCLIMATWTPEAAAAPELLAALEQIDALVPPWVTAGSNTPDGKIRDIARAAIAKAKGEQ